jgi:hypothetical protein
MTGKRKQIYYVVYHRINKKVVIGQADLPCPTGNNHMVFYFLIFEPSDLTWASLVSEMRPLARSRFRLFCSICTSCTDTLYTIRIVPVQYSVR